MPNAPTVALPSHFLLFGFHKGRYCKVCDQHLSVEDFPQSEHEHHNGDQIDRVCKNCWSSWLEAQLSSQMPDHITCAECPEILTEADWKDYADSATYERCLDLRFKVALAADPNYHSCLNSGCDSGQCHDVGRIFICHKCSHAHCVHCGVPWHVNMTCQEYQEFQQAPVIPAKQVEHKTLSYAEVLQTDFSNNQEKAEDIKQHHTRHEQIRASEATIQQLCKPCPGCKTLIQKNGGCPQMDCTRCERCFCSECSVDLEIQNHSPDCPALSDDYHNDEDDEDEDALDHEVRQQAFARFRDFLRGGGEPPGPQPIRRDVREYLLTPRVPGGSGEIVRFEDLLGRQVGSQEQHHIRAGFQDHGSDSPNPGGFDEQSNLSSLMLPGAFVPFARVRSEQLQAMGQWLAEHPRRVALLDEPSQPRIPSPGWPDLDDNELEKDEEE